MSTVDIVSNRLYASSKFPHQLVGPSFWFPHYIVMKFYPEGGGGQCRWTLKYSGIFANRKNLLFLPILCYIPENGTRYGWSYYGMSTGSGIFFIEPCHIQRPWVTPKRSFRHPDNIQCVFQSSDYLADDGSTAGGQRIIHGKFQLVNVALNQHYVRKEEVLKTPETQIRQVHVHFISFNGLKQLNGSVKELNMFHNYETEKITRKASDAVENLQL